MFKHFPVSYPHETYILKLALDLNICQEEYADLIMGFKKVVVKDDDGFFVKCAWSICWGLAPKTSSNFDFDENSLVSTEFLHIFHI